MPELDTLPQPPRPLSRRPIPTQFQRNVLEEQVELWWFGEPHTSLLCYSVSVCLIVGCGLAGVGLLSAASSPGGEWRLGAGMALCLLSLAVLLKQLLSSAVQDMNCVRSRRRIEAIRSGGLSDVLVVLLTGVALVISGLVLLNLAPATGAGWARIPPSDTFTPGVALLAVGGVTVLAVASYTTMVSLLARRAGGQEPQRRATRVFSVSGQMRERRWETTSSRTNLI